jgi:hypothetical protein
MALVFLDRSQQTASSNTTVSFTLSGSVTGFQSLAGVGNGNTTYYSAFDTSGNWEVGLGTYSTSGPTLTRTTIYSSSNSGSAVTFSGTVNVFITYPSGKSINLDAAGVATISASMQVNSLGVGTAASGTAGEIRATNNVTAYYSDDRLKTKLGNIENALDKVKSLSGFYYEANEVAQALGYKVEKEVGVSAQQVQVVMPEVVVPAPIDDKYLTVRYEKLIPLLIEAIKELELQVAELKAK